MAGYRNAVMALAPSAYWRLSETSWANNAFKDVSGNGRHLSITGTPFTLGQPGVLVGDADGSVVVPSQLPGGYLYLPGSTSAWWNASQNKSVVFFIKVASAPASDNYAAFSQCGDGGTTGHLDGGWTAYINTTGKIMLWFQPASVAGDATGASSTVLSDASVCDGNTHMIAFTCQHNGDGTLTLNQYVDSVRQSGYPVTITGSAPSSTDGHNLQLGAEKATSNMRGLNGTLDEFAYWAGTALTATQIATLYSEYLHGAVVLGMGGYGG